VAAWSDGFSQLSGRIIMFKNKREVFKGQGLRSSNAVGRRRRQATAAVLAPAIVETLEQRQLLTALPVAWYRYDEGSGTTAVDSSPNAENGTLTVPDTWLTPYRV
jgi:hypothetical protein